MIIILLVALMLLLPKHSGGWGWRGVQAAGSRRQQTSTGCRKEKLISDYLFGLPGRVVKSGRMIPGGDRHMYMGSGKTYCTYADDVTGGRGSHSSLTLRQVAAFAGGG